MQESLAAPLPGMVFSSIQQRAEVVENREMARDTLCLRLRCPDIARQIVPGQFFMIRPVGGADPLLGRPFALYDTIDESGEPTCLEFGYLVVGKLTSLMASWQASDEVEIWGPLGNGFPVPTADHLMFVAGGIGQTPFLAAAREALGHRTYGNRRPDALPRRVSMCYGVRNAEYVAGEDDFAVDGLDFRLATDDGSRGHHGYVTDLLSQALGSDDPPDGVYCCGPEPMMNAVSAICLERDVPCWLSLETPMACGFGACFSCVVRVRTGDDEWDFRRTCVEGPVFRADQLWAE
ncbi:MAG: dihydroorotate dehydrogenase electron transfer subunit [Planctomycetota bacterium]|nr:dihydroorotate dehydrogenase electron transfer subunit [Planctomycetota bacterium]